MDKRELKVGAYVELEHYGDTRDLKAAAKIAMDHLKEDPTYYSKLYQAGLVDEPKALELAKKYFKNTKQYYMNEVHTTVKDLLSEYEWGKSDGYEYGQTPDWWKGQLAAESVNYVEEPAVVFNKKDKHYYLASVDERSKLVLQVHPLSKSKKSNEICKKNWNKMYKQIHEASINEYHAIDYEYISNPIKMCKG